MVNFGRSENKVAYIYKLTPAGHSGKTTTARRFLERKRVEHDRLVGEIETPRAEMLAAGGRA